MLLQMTLSHLFLWLSNIPWYICTTSSLSIQLWTFWLLTGPGCLSSATVVAKISASLFTEAEQKYGDRDFGGRERWLYFSARQKGGHSRLAPQELCPSSLGIREDFICGARSPGCMIRIKVLKVLHSSFPIVISKQS